MARFSKADVVRRTEINLILRTWVEGGESGLATIVPALKTWLHADRVAIYGLSPDPPAHPVTFLHIGGFQITASELATLHSVAVANREIMYDPARPARAQRNVALRACDIYAKTGWPHASIVRGLFTRLGIQAFDQLRVLACDGPSLLAWVGAWREEHFSEADCRRLQSLAPALRHRLRLERQLGMSGAALAFAALPIALEHIPTAAFVVDWSGAIQLTNSAGAAFRAQHGARSLRAELIEAIRGKAPGGSFDVTELVSPGMTRHFLALRTGARPDARSRLAQVSKAWNLTPRQQEVLGHLASGETNRAIASHLRLAERTIELHVSAVLEKGAVESRAALIARFWTTPVPKT